MLTDKLAHNSHKQSYTRYILTDKPTYSLSGLNTILTDKIAHHTYLHIGTPYSLKRWQTILTNKLVHHTN